MYKITFILILLALNTIQSLEPNEKEITSDEFLEHSSTLMFPVMKEILNKSKLDEYKEYTEGIKIRGTNVLRNLSNEILKINGLNKTTNLSVEFQIESYQQTIQNTFDFVARLDKEFGSDYSYLLLDMLETGCRFLYIEQKKFLKNLSTRNLPLSLPQEALYPQYQSVYTNTVDFKRKEMLNLCKNYRICKPYSPFIEYLESVLDEILLLRDTEIGMIIILFSDLVRNDKYFLKLINSDEKTILHVKVMFTNTFNMKQAITELRDLVKKRYMIYESPDFKYNIRIQAVRVLLDVIDRVFYFNHEREILSDSYDTIKAIREWGDVSDNDVIEIDKSEQEEYKSRIKKFVKIIFKAIYIRKNYLNNYCIQTIITGTLENTTSYANLFQNGFKGVYTLV